MAVVGARRRLQAAGIFLLALLVPVVAAAFIHAPYLYPG